MKTLEETQGEKRRDPRSPILATQVRMGEEWEYFYGYAKNISRSGLFVYTVRPLNVGDEFKIEFTVPGTEISVNCAARVVWERSYHQADTHGPRMGIKFSNIDPQTADRLDQWIASQLKSRQGKETSH